MQPPADSARAPAGGQEHVGGPLVSVIIPTYQRRDLVVRAIRAFDAQDLDPDAWEAVVVVDGSSDGSAEALRDLRTAFRLTVIEQPNRGRPKALNAGARAAAGDILLFLDDDMVADPGMIAAHVGSYEGLSADAVLGALAHDTGARSTILSEEVGRWIDQDFSEARSAHEVIDSAEARFIGGQFSVRRTMFEQVGGFDTGFNRHRGFGNADLDLKLRLHSAGARIVFNGGALSTQTYAHGYRAVWRIFELMGRSNVAIDRKYRGTRPRRTRQVPPAGSRKGMLARGTLRHPFLSSAVAAPAGLLTAPLVDSGRRDRLTRALAYTTLTHRYWYGVAMEGGGHDLGVGGPEPMMAVLAYHRLSRAPLPRQAPWSTSAPRMEAQIRAAIDDGWELVTPDETAGFLEDGGRIPLRSLLITFDDGYADLADRALPVLEELGAVTLSFLPSAKVGGMADWGDAPGPNPSALLDGDQVRELAASGRFEFGVHGATHVPLPGLGDEALEREVVDARIELEALGLPRPRFLAYPYGEFDTRVRRAVAAFTGSFTTQPGLVVPRGDWTRLPRVEVLAGLTPRDLVWRLRRLAWEEGARRTAAAARRRGARILRRLLT